MGQERKHALGGAGVPGSVPVVVSPESVAQPGPSVGQTEKKKTSDALGETPGSMASPGEVLGKPPEASFKQIQSDPLDVIEDMVR